MNTNTVTRIIRKKIGQIQSGNNNNTLTSSKGRLFEFKLYIDLMAISIIINTVILLFLAITIMIANLKFFLSLMMLIITSTEIKQERIKKAIFTIENLKKINR